MDIKIHSNFPRVTVLMPTYNDERYIEEALRSVLFQTMPNFELIIIDDASIDQTSAILAKFAKQDKRIRFFRNKKNLGLTKSLNIGLKHVRSKYIARIDGDDICKKERLEKQVVYMIDHPECDFLATRAVVISEAAKRIKKTKAIFKDIDIKRYLLDIGSPFVHSSMMMRKETLDELGGYNEDWPTKQDYELWLRAAFANKKFACLNEPLVFLRFHKDSLSFSEYYENAIRSLILRGYYRAKEKGREIPFEILREKLEDSELVRSFIKRLKQRTIIKEMIGNLKLCNLSGYFKNVRELLKLITSADKMIGSEEVNAELDLLIEHEKRN